MRKGLKKAAVISLIATMLTGCGFNSSVKNEELDTNIAVEEESKSKSIFDNAYRDIKDAGSDFDASLDESEVPSILDMF